MDFSNKKILVTGADGFIGSHLAEQLALRGAEVKALVYYNSWGSLGNLEHSPALKRLEIVAGDIRDPGFCRGLCQGVDIIFNLAALIAIPYSYIAPESYIHTNVNGAINMLQAAREQGCERFLQVSTSEVYGTAQYVPIDESHPLSPQSPYSASKISAEAVARSFYYAFGLPVVVVRPFNTYGPRQSERALIPSVVTQILSGAKAIKVGNTAPTRDLNFVLDTCKGMMALARCDQAVGEIVNIGAGFEISVHQVIEKIREITGSQAEIVVDPKRLRPEKSEVNRLWCDNARIKAYTGWQPDYTIDAGLEETVAWFARQDIHRYKPHQYNV